MYKCQVYDKKGRLLSPALSSDAIVWVDEGRAIIIQWYSDTTLRTINRVYQVPQAIILTHEVRPNRLRKDRVAVNNYNLFLRDDFTCQYCGRHKQDLRAGEKLTQDHILPRFHGGTNDWLNVTTACSTCNGRKGDKLYETCGLVLRSKPYRPLWLEIETKKNRIKGH